MYDFLWIHGITLHGDNFYFSQACIQDLKKFKEGFDKLAIEHGQHPDFNSHNSTKILILIVLFGFQMGGGGANPLPTDLLTMPYNTDKGIQISKSGFLFNSLKT